MHLTPAEAKAHAQQLGIDLQEGTKGKKPNPYAPYRSKWEADYAVHLESARLMNYRNWNVDSFVTWYERVSFCLVPPSATQRGVWYIPDFTLWSDGQLKEVHEVKGWMRPGAAHKIKALAHMLRPIPVYVVRKDKNGWTRERF